MKRNKPQAAPGLTWRRIGVLLVIGAAMWAVIIVVIRLVYLWLR